MKIPSGKSPAALLSPAVRDEAALALRRKLVVQAAKEAPQLKSIRRVGPLASDAFRDMAAEGEPLIVQGIVEKWPIAALKQSDLAKNFGGLRVRPRIEDYVSHAFTADRTHKEMSLSGYLKLLKETESKLPPYVGNHPLPVPTLCEWPDYFEKWDTPRVWLGPAGTVTPLHCDYDDNLFAQIWGHKRVLLYSPASADLLYLKEFNPILFGSPFDPEQPDYEHFPLAQSAVSVECILGPGDLLYLPAGWFHHVRALAFSLSVNRWTPDEPSVLAATRKRSTK